MDDFSYMDGIVAAGGAGRTGSTGSTGSYGSSSSSTDWYEKITGSLPGLAAAFGTVYGAVKNPGQPQGYEPPSPQPRKDNTMLFIVLGVVAIVIFMIMKKK